MLTKIVFTAAVIAVVVLLVKFRQRPLSAPVPQARRKPPNRRLARVLAVVVLAVMLFGSLLMLYLHWMDSHQVLQVRVIDARSGRVSEYRVYRGRLQERAFETLDGREVRLADTERMEVIRVP